MRAVFITILFGCMVFAAGKLAWREVDELRIPRGMCGLGMIAIATGGLSGVVVAAFSAAT